MTDANTAALRDYELQQSDNDNKWAAFRDSGGLEVMEQHRLETLLANPETYWIAVSCEGMTYPFNTKTLGMTPEQRVACTQRMNAADDAHALAMSALIIQGDDAEIGRCVRRQILRYLKPQIDEWVEDNWHEWARE